MKRIKIYALSLLAAISFSCQMKEQMQLPVNENIFLNLSSTLTKADQSSTEAFVDHLDVFIFASESDGPGKKVYYGRYRVNNSSNLTLDAKRSSFDKDSKYNVFLIANSNISESDFAEMADYDSLVDKFQEDPFLHVSGLDASSAPKYFLMDAVAVDAGNQTDIVINNGDVAADTELSAVLKRAAAKVVINIKAGDNVLFRDYKLADGSEEGRYYVRNLPYDTYLLSDVKSADNIQAKLRNTAKSGTNPYFTWNPVKDAKNVTLTTYVYPHNWINSSILENETCVVMNLPMDHTDSNGETKVYLNSWYKIPMTDDMMFERNNYYEVNINLNRPGANLESLPELVDQIYFGVEEWTNVPVDVGGEIRPDYLHLNTHHVDIYNRNTDETTLQFASSTPIPADGITLLEAYYYNYLDQKVNIQTNDTYKIYSQIKATAQKNVLNGGITINSPFVNGDKEYHSNAIRYLKFRVRNSSGQTEEFTVAQYPTLYITNELGKYSYRSDFGGTDYTRRGNPNTSSVNWVTSTSSWEYSSNVDFNNRFFCSKYVYGNVSSNGSYDIELYYWTSTGNAPTRSSNSTFDNPRMYHVHVTATSADYTVAKPRLDADGFTESTPENTKLVSPSFMIASQLGATNIPSSGGGYGNGFGTSIKELPGGIEQAKRHCEQYVEVTDGGVVYDDWRLPTAAEIDIIISHQDSSDAMAVVLSGSRYYCAYNIESGQPIHTKASGKSSGSCHVRCIRDAY